MAFFLGLISVSNYKYCEIQALELLSSIPLLRNSMPLNVPAANIYPKLDSNYSKYPANALLVPVVKFFSSSLQHQFHTKKTNETPNVYSIKICNDCSIVDLHKAPRFKS